MRTRILLVLTGLLALLRPTSSPGATPARTTPASAPKLNVLFIAADDLNHDLGCYGHPLVKSPNIDKLAARGVRFERAYCQYALCNPTRTSLLSGRRPEVTGIMDNETPPRTFLGDSVVMLPEYFRQRGYFTARVGKIAHSPFENAIKWDVSENAKGRRPFTDSDPTLSPTEREGRLGG